MDLSGESITYAIYIYLTIERNVYLFFNINQFYIEYQCRIRLDISLHVFEGKFAVFCAHKFGQVVMSELENAAETDVVIPHIAASDDGGGNIIPPRSEHLEVVLFRRGVR